jgi:hypothetical protein
VWRQLHTLPIAGALGVQKKRSVQCVSIIEKSWTCFIISSANHHVLQNGFIVKADRDIAFQEHRRRLRSAKGGGMRVEFTRKLPHERRLSVEDVVGTFFVLGSGVIFGKHKF